MVTNMAFDDKRKARTGIICFIPLVSFTICLGYYHTITFAPSSGPNDLLAIISVTNHNYDAMFRNLANSGTIITSVFIYCLVIIVRFKKLNSANKILTCIILPQYFQHLLLQSST